LVDGGEDGAVQWRIDVPAEAMVHADPDHLLRVLMNLARNASQALGKAGTADPSITISYGTTANASRIEIADNGPGIPPTLRDNLFEAFQGSNASGSTGLGLAISADLVRMQGGSIEFVEGEPGATFRITLPGGTRDAMSD
jgi:signal transduction histidine kinase